MAAKRRCSDKDCVTCESRMWLLQQKEARKKGTPLPGFMVQNTSNLCQREGRNYVAQCMDCALAGKDARYEGESSKSPRQHQGQHSRDLKGGLTASPLTMHSLEVHGGRIPRFLFAVRTPEARPWYRAVWESVWIANLPAGLGNLNRCQEWGCPQGPHPGY